MEQNKETDHTMRGLRNFLSIPKAMQFDRGYFEQIFGETKPFLGQKSIQIEDAWTKRLYIIGSENC